MTVLFWGFNFVSLKLIDGSQLPPSALLFVRYAAQWIILAAACRAMGLSLRLPPKHRNRILLVGFLTMGAYMLLFLEGTPRTQPAEAAIVLGTMPIFTWLFSILAKSDVFSWTRLVGSVVAFAGVAGFILGSGAGIGGNLVGDLLVFTGGLFWCAGIVLARPVLVDVKPFHFFTLSMAGALPVVALYGGLPVSRVPWASLSAQTWANLIQLVVGSGVVATACYYRGISDVGAAGATAYQFFVPVVAAGFAWAMLGQAMHPVQAIGVAVTVLGLMLPMLVERLRSRGDILSLEAAPKG